MWDHVWQLLSRGFEEVVETLRLGDAQLWHQAGRQANEVFPFWAYASLGRAPGEEEVVLSVSFKGVDGGLLFTCDISLGNGRILAELPQERGPSPTDAQEWVVDRARDAVRFFKANDELLRAHLRRGGSPPRAP